MHLQCKQSYITYSKVAEQHIRLSDKLVLLPLDQAGWLFTTVDIQCLRISWGFVFKAVQLEDVETSDFMSIVQLRRLQWISSDWTRQHYVGNTHSRLFFIQSSCPVKITLCHKCPPGKFLEKRSFINKPNFYSLIWLISWIQKCSKHHFFKSYLA